MILGLLALCILIVRVFPKTPTALWLKGVLVIQPLEWLSNLKRRDLIMLFVMAALFLTSGEFIAVFGASELFALGAHLSLYLDAMLVTTAATIGAAVATSWRSVSTRFSKWSRPQRARAGRQCRTAKTRQPKSLDDDGAPSWAAAYSF